MKKLGPLLTALLLLCTGLAICSYGLYSAVGVVDMVLHGEQAEARVVDCEREVTTHRSRRRGKSRSTSYITTVSFTDAAGVEHRVKPSVQDDTERRVGDTVTILYKPSEPEDIMLDNWASKTAPTLIPLIVGLAFAGGGILLFKDARPKRSTSRPRRSRVKKAGMCIPAFWVKETQEIAGMRFRLHGSSATSMAEARERLQGRAELQRAFHEEGRIQLATYLRRLAAISKDEKAEAYAVEIFEPTLERLGEQSIVTRNRYGAEVLNTTELCFIDIDQSYQSNWGHIFALSAGKLHSGEERLLRDIEKLCRREPDLGMRVYRTAGGWRLIATGKGLTPDSPRMQLLCERLQADEAYVNLCEKQQCWRARLTPKPGRLERVGRYPRREASDTPAEDEAAWLERYNWQSQAYTVCRLIACYGRECSHPLVAWHDERTGAHKADWPLA